jgi:uncharacterized BrkB/YihY/UPF0761 family membrane protein
MDELHRLNSTADSIDEPLGYPLGRPRRERRRRTQRAWGPKALTIDLVVTIVLTLAQVVTSGFWIFLNLFLGFAFDSCGDPSLTCNYSLGIAAWFIVPVVAVIVLVATIPLVVRNRRKSRLGWWIPFAGIAATYLSVGVAITLTNIATGHSLSYFSQS